MAVRNFDRNGKPIKDLSAVKINLADYPAIINALIKKEKEAA